MQIQSKILFLGLPVVGFVIVACTSAKPTAPAGVKATSRFAKIQRIAPGTSNWSLRCEPRSSAESCFGSFTMDKQGRVVGGALTKESLKDLHGSFVFYRLLPNGDLDPSFADKGILQVANPQQLMSAPHLYAQSEDRVLVEFPSGYGADPELRRLTADGKWDLEFGVSGSLKIPRGASFALGPDGFFLMHGFGEGTPYPTGKDGLTGRMGVGVKAYDSRGQLRRDFGRNGVVSYRFPSQYPVNRNWIGAADALGDVDDEGRLALVVKLTEAEFSSEERRRGPLQKVKDELHHLAVLVLDRDGNVRPDLITYRYNLANHAEKPTPIAPQPNEDAVDRRESVGYGNPFNRVSYFPKNLFSASEGWMTLVSSYFEDRHVIYGQGRALPIPASEVRRIVDVRALRNGEMLWFAIRRNGGAEKRPLEVFRVDRDGKEVAGSLVELAPDDVFYRTQTVVHQGRRQLFFSQTGFSSDSTTAHLHLLSLE